MTDSQPASDEAAEDSAVIDAEVVDADTEVGSVDSVAAATESTDPSEEARDAESDEHPDTVLAAQRLDELQRLGAEYVNYKRRVDRDRGVMQERAVRDVLEALLPVLDDIQAARDHGDLAAGPFAAIADKLETSLGKFGLERFGEVGEEFDPARHEALMHTAWDATNPALPSSATATTVVQILQPGYRLGEQVIRPARVAVADPE